MSVSTMLIGIAVALIALAFVLLVAAVIMGFVIGISTALGPAEWIKVAIEVLWKKFVEYLKNRRARRHPIIHPSASDIARYAGIPYRERRRPDYRNTQETIAAKSFITEEHTNGDSESSDEDGSKK